MYSHFTSLLPAAKLNLRHMAVAAVFTALSAPAFAALPLGGLAIAVTQKGDKLVAAGDTRTLLVLDPKSLAVKERIWLGAPVVNLSFDNTGGRLLVADTDDTAHLHDTNNWKKLVSIPSRHNLAVSIAGNFFAGADRSYSPTAIIFHSMTDGKELRRIALPKNDRIAAMGFDPQGRRLAVLVGPIDTKEEPKLSHNQIPKELQGPARTEFQQKNDGQISVLRIYDAASGKVLSELKTFFTMSSSTPLLIFDGVNIVMNNYSNTGALISPNGEVKLFRTNSGNYALRATADQKLILSGGLRDFAITNTGSLAGVKGEIDKLPGWPEYFKWFAAPAGNQVIYGTTSAYRIFRISSEGKIETVEPVR